MVGNFLGKWSVTIGNTGKSGGAGGNRTAICSMYYLYQNTLQNPLFSAVYVTLRMLELTVERKA